MKAYILDASAILRFVEDESGAEQVQQLFKTSLEGDIQLFISAITWGEINYMAIRAHGSANARLLVDQLKSLPVTVLPVDASVAEAAAEFKETHNLSYADAFAGALAQRTQATLVTANVKDFKPLAQNVIRTQFLPAGRGA
jgi:ribonuclease VapC